MSVSEDDAWCFFDLFDLCDLDLFLLRDIDHKTDLKLDLELDGPFGLCTFLTSLFFVTLNLKETLILTLALMTNVVHVYVCLILKVWSHDISLTVYGEIKNLTLRLTLMMTLTLSLIEVSNVCEIFRQT